MHLFPLSLSSFLSPLPSAFSFLVPSCLSRGRKSLNLETPTGNYSSFGIPEIECKESDLLCLPSSWVARWASGSSHRAAGSVAEGNSKRSSSRPSCCCGKPPSAPAWGWQFNHALFITGEPRLCLFSLVLDFIPFTNSRQRTCFNLQPLKSSAREQYLPFQALLEKTFFFFLEGWGGRFFSCLVYQFLLVLA